MNPSSGCFKSYLKRTVTFQSKSTASRSLVQIEIFEQKNTKMTCGIHK